MVGLKHHTSLNVLIFESVYNWLLFEDLMDEDYSLWTRESFIVQYASDRPEGYGLFIDDIRNKIKEKL